MKRLQCLMPGHDMSPRNHELNTLSTSTIQLGRWKTYLYAPPTVLGALALKIEEVIRPIARAFTGAFYVQQPWGTRGYGGGGGYGGGY